MSMQSFFEQNGGTYTRVGDVLLPDLTLEETESRPIGKYGRMRKRFLKEHHPTVYSSMLLSGKLYEHLTEIDEGANERLEVMISQLARERGITENLKAEDHLCWVQEMNTIRASAEETLLAELIYA